MTAIWRRLPPGSEGDCAMQASESPFPCHWWGIDLENAGLEEVRPDVGTYGQYEFNRLPALPFEMRGDFAWLSAAPEIDQHIGQEKASENIQALASLRESLKRLGLKLPESFATFMESPALHARIRSTTDCYLDL